MITKRLLDVCDFQGGTQPPKDEWINDPREGYVRMLQIRDYSQGDAKFIQYVKDTKKLHKCKKDDIMLSRYGYIGQAFMGLEGAYNVALIKVIKKEEIHTPYLLYYFQSYYFQHFLLSNVGARATIPGFNKDELENALIRLPEMSEQIEIASKIAQVDELIGYHKQQLDTLDTLIKSRFIEMFGDVINNDRNWPMATMGDVAEIKIGPFGTLLHKEDYIVGGHALVNPSHIVDGKISVDISLTISDEKYEELSAYHLKIDDIVLGRRGEMGRCAVVKEEGLLCGTGSLIIRPNDRLKPYFLQTIISNPTYKKIIEDKAVGVTMMNLNVPIVESLRVPMLPIALQNDFISFMEQVDKSKFEIQQSLEKLEILKKSLMQQYFG